MVESPCKKVCEGQLVGQCCGVPGAAAGGPPPVAAWDAQRDWYVKHMSPATALLAHSLFIHLGLFDRQRHDGSDSKLKVLETHCGNGLAASRILPFAAVASYTACDFSPAMLAAAADCLSGKAEVMLADSTSLPFASGTFDRYMSNLGCCCVTDLDAKLQEARRVLAPGGVAAMSMRIADFPGDTAFHLVAETLRPFGMPPGPQREGLVLGRDIPKLKAKLLHAGFKEVTAWRSWVTVPLGADANSFQSWATSTAPVAKFLAGLTQDNRADCMQALERAGEEPNQAGAVFVAVAVVVATV
ncbi:unnamed protein product [Prorocentrum cordatum]|uniref:Methyltransferase type 11 domain-containing protein n=1 Tax=Prorocentrum cordatum TaxID=2364126 RepID=A0ABN9XJ07_9DINO|nr:unnamed protein product [Polarella glacialis]